MKTFQYSSLNIRCITEVLWFKKKKAQLYPVASKLFLQKKYLLL